MYNIMICDDEGIVISSLTFMIEKNFGSECQIAEAKTGRKAIELAADFRPDIVFMDIQMPGINGIEAIKTMKEYNPEIIFIILTAYDRFQYAQQAIDLGVAEYLTKPVSSSRVVEVLQRAMTEIRQRREKISQDLEIREKLETVIPMIEHGLISSIILQEESVSDTENYRQLLGVREEYGYMLVLEYGDRISSGGSIDNPVGASVKFQKCYVEVREIMKEYLNCITGGAMANKVVVLVTCGEDHMEYDERIQVVERVRAMIRKLTQRTELQYRAGIGSVKQIGKLAESYKEAMQAIHAIYTSYSGQMNSSQRGKVMHIEDLPVGPVYEADYPAKTEQELFEAVKRGDMNNVTRAAAEFFQWMSGQYEADAMVVKLKCMEFVLRAEYEAYSHGGMTYSMSSRKGYLEELLALENLEELRRWYMRRITQACHNINVKQQEQSTSLIDKARAYIAGHYDKDLSLDEVSRQVNISPYYFSRLFREETGETFVEYLTKMRIERARELLSDPSLSVKEICIRCGYSDPNYFSRIFKKWTETTPSEYRERSGTV